MKKKEITNQNIETAVDYNAMTYDELSEKSRNYHQQFSLEYDKQQNALCLVMIGGICLIIGFIFVILSFTRVINQRGNIDTSSLQFIFAMACLGAAIVLLTIGLVRFFIAFNKRKQLRTEIDKIGRIKKDIVVSSK